MSHLRGIVVVAIVALGTVAPLCAAECPGDIDADGSVTAADVDRILRIVYSPSLATPAQREAADANRDTRINAADVVYAIGALGRDCALPTPTPTQTSLPSTPTATPSPSATPSVALATATATSTGPPGTPTRTPTITISPTPTRTATPSCDVIPVGPSRFTGTLVANDCPRMLGGQERPTDAFRIALPAGRGVSITVTNVGSSPLVPYLQVVDPSGTFESVSGRPAIHFTTSTSEPYTFVIGAAPNSPDVLGSYEVLIETKVCPTPLSIRIPASQSRDISGNECVDPYYPSVGPVAAGVDEYLLDIPNSLSNVFVQMRQVSAADIFFPELLLYGPTGKLLVDSIDNFDCTGEDDDRECVSMRLMILKPGVHRLLAGGGGRTGRYSLTVQNPSPPCRTTVLGALPAQGPILCAGQPGPGCVGTWYGDLRRTSCAAPLFDPDEDQPEVGSPADLYSFTAAAGDTVRVELVTDDPYVYLLGPSTAGNPLVGFATSSVLGDSAIVTATLPQSGTYSIVAANGIPLEPPDEDEGESVEYTLIVERVLP